MIRKRKTYESPSIEVIAMESEGIMASSILQVDNMTPENIPNGGSMASSSSLENDLENLINDILTY